MSPVSPSPADNSELTRRRWLTVSAGLTAAAATGRGVRAGQSQSPGAAWDRPGSGFHYCLNMATIRGQKLTLPQQIDVAADAGYQGIEPWVGDIKESADKGRPPEEIAKQLRDRGVEVPSTIAFIPWVVNDARERARGLEQAKREMDLARRLGATRIAAPPAGARDNEHISLSAVAERYRALVDLGVSMGIVPQLELWGFSKVFSRLSEAVLVAMNSDHPAACLLLDVFHLYKGGTNFEELKFVSGRVLHVLHINDYPARPPRSAIDDSFRVFPGDGVAPLRGMLRTLHENRFDGFLSLEVFNRDYWRQDAHLVARTGIKKMRAVVEAALAPAAHNS